VTTAIVFGLTQLSASANPLQCIHTVLPWPWKTNNPSGAVHCFVAMEADCRCAGPLEVAPIVPPGAIPPKKRKMQETPVIRLPILLTNDRRRS
jgi:hypothetical protein